MTDREALDLVLELAEQNIIDADLLPDENERQEEACNIVRKLILEKYPY